MKSPQYAMCFAVTVPNPLPYVAEIELRPDGTINRRPGKPVDQMLLTLGAASAFYGIPVDVLRERWIHAALTEPSVDGSSISAWGVCYAEWLDVLSKHPEIEPERFRHIFPDDHYGTHNNPTIQGPLEAAWLNRPRPMQLTTPTHSTRSSMACASR
jgi:hypothetical protein